jgi:hypothetical protein
LQRDAVSIGHYHYNCPADCRCWKSNFHTASPPEDR